MLLPVRFSRILRRGNGRADRPSGVIGRLCEAVAGRQHSGIMRSFRSESSSQLVPRGSPHLAIDREPDFVASCVEGSMNAYKRLHFCQQPLPTAWMPYFLNHREATSSEAKFPVMSDEGSLCHPRKLHTYVVPYTLASSAHLALTDSLQVRWRYAVHKLNILMWRDASWLQLW